MIQESRIGIMGVGKIADSLFLRLSEQGDVVWQQVLDAWNVNVSPLCSFASRFSYVSVKGRLVCAATML